MIDFWLYFIAFVILLGVCVFSVWSVINTRNSYYKDFMKRKSEREKLRLSR